MAMADDSTARDERPASRTSDGGQPSDETTMDDILRSIRSILSESGAPEGRDGFELNAVASNANDEPAASKAVPAPVGPGGPLAFIQKRKPHQAATAPEAAPRETTVQSAEPAGEPGSGDVSDQARKLTLEDRLERHRRKADAERLALRRLTARAAGGDVSEVGVPVPEEAKDAAVDPLIERFEEAFAASDELFEPSGLPEVPTEEVDYSARVPRPETAQPLAADRAPVPVPGVEEIARALLENQGDAIHEAMREMLRPMVRDWLDDNMSSIVEKVVREEIERVSRARR